MRDEGSVRDMLCGKQHGILIDGCVGERGRPATQYRTEFVPMAMPLEGARACCFVLIAMKRWLGVGPPYILTYL